MSLDALLLTCLTNKTSFKGTGNSKVSLQEQTGEKAFFFDISDQADAKSLLRRDWGMKDDEPICDGLILYIQRNKRILCFVELKGSDLEHAVEQILNTQEKMSEAVKSKLRDKPRSPYFDQLECRAYIYLSGSIPSDNRTLERVKKSLRTRFGTDKFFYGSDSDIGNFLRQ